MKILNGAILRPQGNYSKYIGIYENNYVSIIRSGKYTLKDSGYYYIDGQWELVYYPMYEMGI